jgi:DNA-binding transcriptional ArsR family regulator
LYRHRVQVSTTTDALARFGHALSDPTRTRVLLALREAPAYPADLAESLGVSRQIMSHHLACLRGCGLVVSVPVGRRSRYELTDARIGHALGDLLQLVLVVDPACTCAEKTPPQPVPLQPLAGSSEARA